MFIVLQFLIKFVQSVPDAMRPKRNLRFIQTLAKRLLYKTNKMIRLITDILYPTCFSGK